VAISSQFRLQTASCYCFRQKAYYERAVENFAVLRAVVDGQEEPPVNWGSVLDGFPAVGIALLGN
jgi:hypothetical protein